MTFIIRALPFTSALLIAACGGGSGAGGAGDGAIGGGGPQTVTLSEANAKPVAANALEAAQNTSAARGATELPVGVQVDSAATAPMLHAIVDATQFAAQRTRSANLPAGVQVSETQACERGGTMTISGNVANPDAGLAAGDTITITNNGCSILSGGATLVLNGQMSMSLVSGSISALPLKAIFTVTATNLSVQSGGTTVVSNGDTRIDWSAASASMQTVQATGAALSSRITSGSTTHTTTMRNYSQTLTMNGFTFTSSVSATVETDSTRIAAAPVSYTIETLTPVTWNATTRLVSAGAVRVTGANDSRLVLTLSADSTATIQLDANGDGTFERTIPTDAAELGGLL